MKTLRRCCIVVSVVATVLVAAGARPSPQIRAGSSACRRCPQFLLPRVFGLSWQPTPSYVATVFRLVRATP